TAGDGGCPPGMGASPRGSRTGHGPSAQRPALARPATFHAGVDPARDRPAAGRIPRRMNTVVRRLGRAIDSAARQDDRDIRPLPFPGTFAFIGSGCLLVLEILAGRIVAPSLGVSLYTWTSVIGVVLAGLSLGNWLGGKIADWRPGRSMLSLLYLLSAIASTVVLGLSKNLDSIAAPTTWSAELQVLW